MLAIPARTWERFKSYLTLHNRALKTCFQCRRVYLANKKIIKSRLIVGYDNSGEFALPPPLGFGTKFTLIVVIKIFAIDLPPQSFLGRHLGFHILFHLGLFGGRTFFLQLGCFGLDIPYGIIYYLCRYTLL